MQIVFFKYHGAGNDFILIDNRQALFPEENAAIARLCDRRKGIGADGVLLVEASEMADYKVRIFNADGSQPSMCGNGIRCVCAFIESTEKKSDMRVEVAGRMLHCKKRGDAITVNLGAPRVSHWPIELLLQHGKRKVYVLDTGVPHAVVFVEDLVRLPFVEASKEIRLHPAFAPEGVNVNFVQLVKDKELWVRTYERGVEGETLACGTGAAATAWAAAQLYPCQAPLSVWTRRSMDTWAFEENLRFSFLGQREAQEIEMTGPALPVFSGVVEYSTL